VGDVERSRIPGRTLGVGGGGNIGSGAGSWFSILSRMSYRRYLLSEDDTYPVLQCFITSTVFFGEQ
jgi:hypothetical protein